MRVIQSANLSWHVTIRYVPKCVSDTQILKLKAKSYN